MTINQYVLLVEDDLDISEAICMALESENYKVISTKNGKEAMDFLNMSKENPSLILLDIRMPLMNGYEFRKFQLQNKKISNIPTVVLSAVDKNEDFSNCKFSECLYKPLELNSLISTVKKIIH